MKHITTADALRALEEAVAEKGEDYAYQYPTDDPNDWRSWTCLYAYNGAPSCIAGNALHRLGVPLDAFEPHEADPITDVIDELITSIAIDATIEPGAVDALAAAQQAQDTKDTWGRALQAAYEAVTPDA